MEDRHMGLNPASVHFLLWEPSPLEEWGRVLRKVLRLTEYQEFPAAQRPQVTLQGRVLDCRTILGRFSTELPGSA